MTPQPHTSRLSGPRRLLALLALLCASWSVTALASTPPEHHKERFAYEVSWRGGRVASLQLVTGCPTAKHIPAALTAQSVGLASELHRFAVRLDTFLSPERYLPFQGRTQISENDSKRSYISSFSPNTAVTVHATIAGEARDPVTHTLPAPSHDLLSWLLHLRWQTPLSKGLVQRYFVWDGWKLVELTASVKRVESVSAAAKTYQAWAIDVTRARHPLGQTAARSTPAQREELGTLWIERDSPHQLVGMDFTSRIGLANIRLSTASRTPCQTP